MEEVIYLRQLQMVFMMRQITWNGMIIIKIYFFTFWMPLLMVMNSTIQVININKDVLAIKKIIKVVYKN